MLWVTRKLFLSEEMPLEQKIRRFELFTSEIDFYRANYFQLHDLASLLAIRYPTDKRVVELYANHLIASGQLEEALQHYKAHLKADGHRYRELFGASRFGKKICQ